MPIREMVHGHEYYFTCDAWEKGVMINQHDNGIILLLQQVVIEPLLLVMANSLTE